MKKKNGILIASMVILVIVLALASALLTLQGGLNQQAQMPSGLGAQSEGGQQQSDYHQVNITMFNEQDQPLKNVWVVLFKNNVAELYGFTGEQGNISFRVTTGYYLIQFEKYHYNATPLFITINKDTDISQTMHFEEITFGAIPSWIVMSLIGIVFLGLIYWNRESLGIGRWGKPGNWFGSSRKGSWTFLDKSTKIVLYGITAALLVVLIIFIVPNFPTFNNMSFYYILIGIAVLAGLLIEGKSNKYWIAAIGFGKSKELLGSILIGISFALLFIGITGFTSQLAISSSVVLMGSWISIFMFVIVAAFFEEGFFSGIIAPTLAEKTGIISSIVVTSIIFMLAHGLNYGWALIPLISALIFRVFATIIVLYRKSWIGIFVAHIIINAISLLSIAIFS